MRGQKGPENGSGQKEGEKGTRFKNSQAVMLTELGWFAGDKKHRTPSHSHMGRTTIAAVST